LNGIAGTQPSSTTFRPASIGCGNATPSVPILRVVPQLGAYHRVLTDVIGIHHGPAWKAQFSTLSLQFHMGLSRAACPVGCRN
jgi:hypothetical protein